MRRLWHKHERFASMDQLFGNSLWFLVKQSDVVTKGVLLLLLTMSIACWTIFLYKIIMYRLKHKQLRDVSAALKQTTGLEGLLVVADRCVQTLPGYLISKGLVMFKGMVAKDGLANRRGLTEQACAQLSQNIDHTVVELVQTEEAYVPVLSISAAVSPLLGLFGTVWGLIHAFVRIGELQTADIATVAPGIAEALITTLAGLIVAIPALVMYHHVANRIRSVERQLYVCADQVVMIMQGICAKE